MYQVLAIFSGIIGLVVSAAAVYTVWYIRFFVRQAVKERESAAQAEAEAAASEGSASAGQDAAGTKKPGNDDSPTTSPGMPAVYLARAYLLRWTAFDYATLLLVLTGFVFLLVDVLALNRDRAGGAPTSEPYYHFGYLTCGFVFALLGVLFLFVRFAIVLRVARGPLVTAPHDHHEPDQAHEAE